MRFFIYFLLFLLGFGVFFYVTYSATKKVRQWINKVWHSGVSYVTNYTTKIQQERKRVRSLSELPIYMQQGMQRLSAIKQDSKTLPEQWRLLLRPVIAKADEIAYVVIDNPKHAESVRRFFTVTLDAFEGFVDALAKEHQVMGKAEQDKAIQSIEVFRKDFLAYDAKLGAKRRFDFQVLMDVIKHRLRR